MAASDAPPPEDKRRRSPREALFGSRVIQVLRHADFRLLWIGAFLSFTGSWIQNIAQGYYVFQVTHDERKLAAVSFAWSLPVLLLGLFAGSFSDHLDKRRVLIVAQAFFATTALFLAAATWLGFVQYWHILIVALLNGIVACIEMPARQSIVSRVVPPEDLAAAVPINAMTFNVARIFGPAIGGLVLASLGVAACYFLNGLSFIALIWAALAIRANLQATEARGPIKDLVFEGMLYTLRDHRLRALLLLEGITAIFGIAYMPLIPAYIHDVLGIHGEIVEKIGNSKAYTAIGIGALAGLLLVTSLAESERKGTIIRVSMWSIAITLTLLSLCRSEFIAYPLLAILGASTISQFNTTNALFQLLAPERLRGRVLAMHIWALNGLSPFGVLFFGWLAQTTRTNPHLVEHLPSAGVPLSMQVAAVFVLAGAVAATRSRRGLSNLF